MTPLDPSTFVEVHFLRLPVQVWARAQEHGQELLREFALISQQVHDDDEDNDVPARLIQLVDDLTARYAGLSNDQEAALADAAAAGTAEIADLTFPVPPEVGDAVRELGTALDLADAYCRAGQHLLTMTTPPEALRFRQWYLGELLRQIDGHAPTSWPDYQG